MRLSRYLAVLTALLMTWEKLVHADESEGMPPKPPKQAPAQNQQGAGGSLFEVEYGASIWSAETGFIRAHSVNLGWAYRLGRVAVGVQTGANVWRAPLYGTDEQEHVGVWNVGPKVEWRFAQERARSQLCAGASVVIEPSAVDVQAGSVGFYIDARPLGLRFPLGSRWAIGLDPLGSALRVPDTSGVPLVEVQFMSYLRMETAK